MLDFIRKSFRKIFEIFLWINLFASTAIGGIIGYLISNKFARPNISLIVGSPAINTPNIIVIVVFTLIGVGIGLLIGIFVNIIFGGIVANILAMQQSLENAEKYLKFLVVEKKKSEKENLSLNGNAQSATNN